MSRSFRGNMRPDNEIGRDTVLENRLRVLDPMTDDPSYWLRFRERVMSQAVRGLAQRRVMASLTVSDVVASWARTIVPTAAIAAALAGILLLRAGSVDVAPVSAELSAFADGEPVPVLLSPGASFAALGPEAF